jgi:DNA mismatch repair protein MutS2
VRFFAGESTGEALGFSTIWERVLPKSSLGRRVKSRVEPKLPGQEEELKAEHRIVSSLTGALRTYPDVFSRLDSVLMTLKDPFHSIILLKEDKTLTSTEIFILAHLAFSTGRVRSVMAESPVKWPERAVPPSLEAVEKKLLPGFAGQPVFYIADSYSPELSRVRAERKSKEKLRRAEMTKEASREALRLEREISRLRQKETLLESEVLASLSADLRKWKEQLEKAAWALGELDYLLRKVELASLWNAREPVINREVSPLVLEEAFHPQVREEVEGRGGRYQPVSLAIDSPVSVVTGPNMGGKTASLATVGLCVSLPSGDFCLRVPAWSFLSTTMFTSSPKPRGNRGFRASPPRSWRSRTFSPAYITGGLSCLMRSAGAPTRRKVWPFTPRSWITFARAQETGRKSSPAPITMALHRR